MDNQESVTLLKEDETARVALLRVFADHVVP